MNVLKQSYFNYTVIVKPVKRFKLILKHCEGRQSVCPGHDLDLMSQSGVKQGDSLGPLLFSLRHSRIHYTVRSGGVKVAKC